MPSLEMAIVMMKPTMVPVIMMLEIVVELSTLISVPNAFVILMDLSMPTCVHLDHLLLQLEMDTAMMKPTSKNAYLMDKIVVELITMMMVTMIFMTVVIIMIMNMTLLLYLIYRFLRFALSFSV